MCRNIEIFIYEGLCGSLEIIRFLFHVVLFFNEKTSGFDGYIASENIDAAYIMYNYNWINKD